MTRDFDDLLAMMSPERRAGIAHRVEEIHSSPLYRFRKALHFIRAAVSRLERRSD
jgi:hypothetical protein